MVACPDARTPLAPTRLARILVCALAMLFIPVAAWAQHWVAAWAMAPVDHSALAVQPASLRTLDNETLRQRVVVTAGGSQVRVRLSNLYGTTPLAVGAASVARSTGGDAIARRWIEALSFQGRREVQVAPGAQVWSDPIRLPVVAGQALAVSVYLREPSILATGHPGVPPAAWSLPGDQTMAAKPSNAQALPWNPLVTGVDVLVTAPARVVAAFGDSITDGPGVSDNAVDSYPAQLATRRRAADGAAPVAVVNLGISGNRLLRDGNGPSGMSRFGRDVLEQSGVTHALILIGINDIGYGTVGGVRSPLIPAQQFASADEIVAGLQQIVRQARARGVKVLLGTLLPFKGSPYWSEENEHARQAVNRWIRGRQDVDAVIDFDAALRSPGDALSLAPAFDSGDHLHPSKAGLAAMAAAADVAELSE